MIVERYRDSEAAMAHAANIGPSDLSDELRARLAGNEAPVVFTPYRPGRVADGQ